MVKQVPAAPAVARAETSDNPERPRTKPGNITLDSLMTVEYKDFLYRRFPEEVIDVPPQRFIPPDMP